MADTPAPPLLLELLSARAAALGPRTLFTYVNDAGTVSATLTYAALEARTRIVAIDLLTRRAPGGAPMLRPGDTALLVFAPSLDFIVAFIACLRARVVPVPVYPPDPRNLRVNVTLFAAVAASSGARVALTHSTYSTAVSLSGLKDTALRWLGLGASAAAPAPQWPDLSWVTLEEAERGGSATIARTAVAALPTLDAARGDDIAFLQYTSGSTSEPKGVIITHANVAHNLRTIVSSLSAGAGTVVASWLPQYHDMGLIGSYLGVLACGGSGVYASPLSFLKDPLLWLQLVTRYSATHVQAPNFAYALVARRFREEAAATTAAAAGRGRAPRDRALNLTSLRHCFNAAEPVTAAALSDFSAAFTPVGFSPSAFAPGYGLAEHTVYVSDGGTRVLYLDRNALEGAATSTDSSGYARVLASCSIVDLHSTVGAASSAACAAAAKALVPAGKPPLRVATIVSCGPITSPPGFVPAAAPQDPAFPLREVVFKGLVKNADVWVMVVDADSCCPMLVEGHVGEVWVHSPSRARGYYGKAEATAATFHARIAPQARTDASVGAGSTAAVAAADATRAVQWLRTGDLGFVWGGELFICGRIKDLIIVKGRNYYPQDLENSAMEEDSAASQAAQRKVGDLRPGALAAFTVHGSSSSSSGEGGIGKNDVSIAVASSSTPPTAEALVLVAEVREGTPPYRLPELATLVRASIARSFGLRLDTLLLLAPGGTRKTTSGKIARALNARAFAALMRGDPPALSPWHSAHGLVLFAWHASPSEVMVEEDEQVAPDGVVGGGSQVKGEEEGGASLPPPPPHPTTPRQPGVVGGELGPSPPPPTTPPPLARYRHLIGGPLRSQLASDLGKMLSESNPSSLPDTLSLLELGLDSLSLASFAPKLREDYGLHVSDALVFAEGCTLGWLVRTADALREGPVDPPAGAGGGEGTQTRTARAVEEVGGGSESASEREAAAAAAAYRARGGGSTAGTASYVETSCPCFLICCG